MDARRSQSYVAAAAPARPAAWHGHTHKRMTVADVDVCDIATTVSVEVSGRVTMKSAHFFDLVPRGVLAEWRTPL